MRPARPVSVRGATHTRLPNEKITLAECQALIESKYAESVVPARVASRFAVLASAAALLLAIAALVVAALR